VLSPARVNYLRIDGRASRPGIQGAPASPGILRLFAPAAIDFVFERRYEKISNKARGRLRAIEIVARPVSGTK
jgi:hypothetical protein